jgi:hypothetical protein
LVASAVICITAACAASVPAARSSEMVVEGHISKIVDKMVQQGYGKKRLVISSTLNLDGEWITIHFGVSDSALTDKVVYRGNCVASPADRLIDCDLKLIDDLIHDFYLDKQFKASEWTSRLRYYRWNLLLWVIAHEIGHIALKHGLSDFSDASQGMSIFDAVRQKYELAADAYAIRLVGKLDAATTAAYRAIMDVVNLMMRKSVCPETFPDVCDRMPVGVGLIFDYTLNAKPVLIPAGATHPAFIARFLRILYLSGIGTNVNSINYEARQAIDLLQIQNSSGTPTSLRLAIEDPQVP